uniref:RING-type domain-containing protein n=1 Tax=Timema douglasi TaxID=61478 RepID=A0A7R8Z6L8_TIMDO|nr:unnamed protein product [Timema douglasi]
MAELERILIKLSPCCCGRGLDDERGTDQSLVLGHRRVIQITCFSASNIPFLDRSGPSRLGARKRNQKTSSQNVYSCTICQDTLNNVGFRILPCEHSFHGSCIDRWFKTPPDESPSSPHTPSAPLIPQSSDKVATYPLDKEGDRENKERNQGKQQEHAGPAVRQVFSAQPGSHHPAFLPTHCLGYNLLSETAEVGESEFRISVG